MVVLSRAAMRGVVLFPMEKIRMADPYAWMTNALGTGSPMPTRESTTLTKTPGAPLASSIATAGTAVTVFAADAIATVADIVNPPAATEPLYIDFVATAAIGSATSIPLSPGQAYRISSPLSTAVTAVAATAGHSFVAVTF